MAEPQLPPQGTPNWDTIAAQARTLQGRPSSTIEFRARSGAPDALPPADGDRLELGDTLGEGGMGIVRLGVQRSMGRLVAVKTPRHGTSKPEYRRKLLQEAWTTGRLEHPNVIPIYDIAMGGDGDPLVVLKRVVGESWAKLLRDPERMAEFVDGTDTLDRHLRVLEQVCRALHFAHSRDIVHLDLKPDNVMLGRHGEVYLLDWGIAMSLRDDGTGQVPLAAEHRGIVGTPHYLAPEMLEGDGTKLDARTDVYLLGATLFEVLAGRPPHRGDTIMEVLQAAVLEEPELPPDAPAELAAICRKAIARKPGERYESVEAVRRALQAFQRHRESARIADHARERLAELESTSGATQMPGRQRQALFAQARFGFEQALASWPENDAAKKGLSRAFEVMVQLELDEGDPHVAAALAREAPDLPAELRDRIDEAVAERRASLDELMSRRRDQDPRIGQRTRAFVFSVLAILWTAMPLSRYFLPPLSGQQEYLAFIAIPGFSLLMLGLLTIWARDSLSRTRINRIGVAALFITLLGQLLLAVGGMLLRLPPEQCVSLFHVVWAMGASIVLTVERRAFPMPVIYVLSFFATIAWPAASLLFVAASHFALLVTVAILWRPQQLRGPIPAPDHRT